METNSEKCPTVPKQLIAFLASIYPDRCARLEDTERSIFFKAGQRSVIDYLIQRYNEQQDDVFRT